ncbi:MAG TPA: HTTM domain-containing protein, partial [Candidatus Nanopelagicales bacterium]|nr:HTTM domain-containing protein [Candidatus Nanopelagicales bacterium]
MNAHADKHRDAEPRSVLSDVLLPFYDRTGSRYSWWDLLRDSYFTFDRRTLGFTRILLGLYLIGDLFRRTWDWEDMFSNEGVLPTHVNLFRRGADNFSVLNAFSTAGELWVLWGLILATYLCLLFGFKTKIAQVLSLLWVASMNGRVLLIENGGYVVHNLLLLWTCFLPLGDRFSIDALRDSLRRSRERGAADLNDRSTLADPDKPDRYVTLLGVVLLLQLASIYFFNVVHKTGPNWKNGTAVHYVLYVDRMVTPGVAALRDHIPNWMILFMTKSTLAFEASIPVCLLAPLGRVWARRLVVGMMNSLHLAFGVTFVLGPFAWALCVFSTLLFGKEDWELASRTMRRAHRARVVRFDPASPGALSACRVLMRMDRFGLLTFEEQPGLGGRLVAVTPGGGAREGADALADIVAALPLGPVMAWTIRAPVLRALWGTLLTALDSRSAGLWLGLRAPESAGVAPPPP